MTSTPPAPGTSAPTTATTATTATAKTAETAATTKTAKTAATTATEPTPVVATPSAPTARRPRRSRWALDARDLAHVATFAALTAALGLAPPLYVLGGAVPITAQTLGVMLAGTLLGAYRGALAMATFVALVAAGLPLLSGGRGGLSILLGPSGGYVVAWIAGAALVGWLVQRTVARRGLSHGVPRSASRTLALDVLVAALVGGVAFVYACGIPWQAAMLGLPQTTVALGALAFVPGDLLKAVVAASVTVAVLRAYPAAPVLRAARG
ncbi:biotin transport system substrate-specific component [Sediminihabitans luteus]|uniref:Biotin transport system substrate-specific component n=1 Tax=Sediminihabitans luteus TaxID=1138585 RepID=A0A2M9CY68_9CELL|nr:biotin transporter BioY [Sediminihabitans luteus]PJJ76869.1 biotin transport system substrate-specific component [Sediminihabitans luteus]GIJ00350.1 hypothetical protein Slu03_27270 [Sediminihabitans luteus]